MRLRESGSCCSTMTIGSAGEIQCEGRRMPNGDEVSVRMAAVWKVGRDPTQSGMGYCGS